MRVVVIALLVAACAGESGPGERVGGNTADDGPGSSRERGPRDAGRAGSGGASRDDVGTGAAGERAAGGGPGLDVDNAGGRTGAAGVGPSAATDSPAATDGPAAGGAPAQPSQSLPVGGGGLPLFVGEVGGGLPDTEADGSLHLVLGADDEAGHVSTHLPNIDLSAQFSGVAFEVRGAPPTTLYVCLTPIVDSYWADAAAGFTWRCATVSVNEEYASHEAAFSDMAPVGEGEVRPLADSSGSQLHFLVLDAAEGELWLRNIVLE